MPEWGKGGSMEWPTDALQRLLMNLRVGGGDETLEQRVRPVGFAQEFRVELAGHEERMIRQLDQLDEQPVRRGAAEDHAGLLEPRPVAAVELIPVPVPFLDQKRTVKLGRARTDDELAGL